MGSCTTHVSYVRARAKKREAGVSKGAQLMEGG